MCVCVCLYVEPVSRSKDHVWSQINIGSAMFLYTPVSPGVPEMEGIYVTGVSFFEHVPLVEFKYLVFTRIPGGDTVGDSGLCCRVPCLSSAIISLCLLILHKRCRPHSVSDYHNSFWGQRVNACMCVFICWASFKIKGLCPILNKKKIKNWFCCMPVHTHVGEDAQNGGYTCHWGASCFEDEPLIECMYPALTRMPLLLCPLSFECY